MAVLKRKDKDGNWVPVGVAAKGASIASVVQNGDETIVTFSDGTQMTVHNGKTPVKGVDYWTQLERQQIVQETLSAMQTWTGGSF